MEKKSQRVYGSGKKMIPVIGTYSLFLALIFMPFPVAAATGTGAITSSFKSIYNIIAAIVTSIGQLYLLWGVFEWATSLNGQDGVGQSMAFKRISAGLVACMAPTIITMITY